MKDLKKEASIGTALLGAGMGAYSAGEGNRLKGALAGGAAGGALGALGGAASTKLFRNLAHKKGVLLPKNLKNMDASGLRAAGKTLETSSLGELGTVMAPSLLAIPGSMMAGRAAGNYMNEKRASLCISIAGTINKEDFERFNDLYEDPTIGSMIEKSASVRSVLLDLVSEPIPDASEMRRASIHATKTAGYDVIQIRPSGYGYLIKTSQAPEGMQPQEQQVSAEEAQASGVPPEAMQAADQQGAATMTNVQAQPDPMVEQPQPATTFGTYKVTNAQNGRQIVGFVIPGLFDPLQGQPTQQSLFTTGNAYAIQPQVMGVLTGISFNLPEANPPRGMGIFYKTDGKSLMATIPYNIVSEVTVEGRTYYSVQTQEGQQLQIVMSQGLQRPVASSPTEIVMPDDFKFLPLDNPIQLAGGENMMKAAQAAAWETMGEIRAWEGGVKLSGPVFEKMGSGEHEWADGLFYLAATGLAQNLAMPMLEKAAHTGEVIRLFGLRALSPREGWLEETAKEARADMELYSKILPRKVCLLKEAAALTMEKEASDMLGTSTVDSILALNFLNPENVSTFAEAIPQLKESAEKLADLVLACQLGLQPVSKTAAVRAMFAIETVVQGLQALKEYRI